MTRGRGGGRQRSEGPRAGIGTSGTMERGRLAAPARWGGLCMEKAQLKLTPKGQTKSGPVGAGGGSVAEETTPCMARQVRRLTH